MNTKIRKRIEEEGAKFFQVIGIKKEQTLLDFGCGGGCYTIPASKVAGRSGKEKFILRRSKMPFGFGKRRRGRGFRGFGGGMPPTSCICPNCRIKVPYQPAVPCFKMKCPRCGSLMTRKFPDEK